MFKAKTKGGTGSVGLPGTGGDYGMLYLPGASKGRTIASGGNVFTYIEGGGPDTDPTLIENSPSVTLGHDINKTAVMLLANAGAYQVTCGVSFTKIPVVGCCFSLCVNDTSPAVTSIGCSPPGAGTITTTSNNLMISQTLICFFEANTRLSLINVTANNTTGLPVEINSVQLAYPPPPAAYITLFRLQ